MAQLVSKIVQMVKFLSEMLIRTFVEQNAQEVNTYWSLIIFVIHNVILVSMLLMKEIKNVDCVRIWIRKSHIDLLEEINA